MLDVATASAAIGAALSGVELIDKISDQIERFLTRRTEPDRPHRVRIEREGDAIVQKVHGVVVRRITGPDLEKLPEAQLRHIKVYEQSMENHYAIWSAVYPQLALADPIEKARLERKLQETIVAMKRDLLGILDFLISAGLDLEDHYSHIRHVVSQVPSP